MLNCFDVLTICCIEVNVSPVHLFNVQRFILDQSPFDNWKFLVKLNNKPKTFKKPIHLNLIFVTVPIP